jgi:hypothetical protein
MRVIFAGAIAAAAALARGCAKSSVMPWVSGAVLGWLLWDYLDYLPAVALAVGAILAGIAMLAVAVWLLLLVLHPLVAALAWLRLGHNVERLANKD